MNTCKLLNILCHVPDERDLDEIYLAINKKKIWPKNKKYKQLEVGPTELNFDIKEVERGQTIEIQLWDYDLLSRNDFLGTFKLILDSPGGGLTQQILAKKIPRLLIIPLSGNTTRELIGHCNSNF